jgi:translation initiation factor RLI1
MDFSRLTLLLLLFPVVYTILTGATDELEETAATRQRKNALLSWTDIKVRYKKRNILHLHAGEVYSGRLLGVLGPSGLVIFRSLLTFVL